MITKHITLADKQTTIALEPIFWTAINDQLADETVRGWITDCISSKPGTTTRASWIRQRVLINMLKNVKVSR